MILLCCYLPRLSVCVPPEEEPPSNSSPSAESESASEFFFTRFFWNQIQREIPLLKEIPVLSYQWEATKRCMNAYLWLDSLAYYLTGDIGDVYITFKFRQVDWCSQGVYIYNPALSPWYRNGCPKIWTLQGQ